MLVFIRLPKPTGSWHHKPAGGCPGDCLASGDHTQQDDGDGDDESYEFKLDVAAVAAEEAVERKEARACLKPK
jgi:hypothetical protein